MTLKEKVEQAVGEYLEGKDIVLISLKCSASSVIEVTLDSMEGVTIDTCIEANRFIESRLDREEQDFELTVGSASISEPMTHPLQYRKNISREVEIMEEGSRTKLIATLADADDNGITVTYKEKVAQEGKKRKVEVEQRRAIPFSALKSVRLHFR
ncbi:MAG: ribosome assembly cofactor RimP [Rikenellaceae bacterium]|nr:ribosome assembly cofactor RimP [Rikenellaceae bacterium]